MNLPDFSQFRMSEPYWRGLIFILSAAVILITIWCLSHGITIIFMHLYYFPIVLLAYRYRYRGFVLATLLSLAYVSLVVIYHPEPAEITGALYRFAVFAGIAGVIAYLSEQLATVQLSQKERMETIQNLQQFQESVITNANIWISVLAPNGTVLIWNDAAETISGYKKSDVVGKRTVWKQLYPDNAYRKKVTREIQRIIGRDTLFENFDTEIRCADGSIKTIVWNARSLHDFEGKVTGYIAIGRDITKQIRAEAEIRHLASFPQLTPVNIIETDLGGRILFINPAMENTLVALGISDPGLFIPADFLEKAASESPGTQPAHQERELVIQGSTFTLNLAFVPESRSVRVYATDITLRKKTEKKFRESERKFREIFNNINDAVHLHELSPDGRPGRFLDVNDAACRMLMVSRDELLAHNPLDYATDYHNPPLDEVTRQLRTRGSATFETGHRRADGTIVPVEINAHVIILMGKTVVLSVIRDLTYRKKVEKELKISNVILLTQQETSPDGILIVDESGKILSFNRRFTEIWGIPDDLIASNDDEPVLQYVTGQLADPDAFLSRVMYLYDHKNEKSHEEIRLKDERVLERYSAPMLGKDNHYFGRVWYFHDITERKRAEETIAASEMKFRQFFNNINDALYSHTIGEQGLPGKFIEVNDVMCERLGYSRDELLQLAPRDIVSDAGRSKMPSIAEIMARKEHVTFETEHLRKDGSIIPVEINTVIFSFAGTRIAMASARDVTERKRAEEEIKRSIERFRMVMDSIDALVYVVDMQTYELLFINKYGRDIWGEGIEGKVCWQIIQSGQKGPCPFCTNARLVDEKGNLTGIYNWEVQNTVNGHWYDCRDSAIRWLDGRVVRLEIATDISGRKRIEEALNESRQLFSDIISFLPDPTFVIDKDGKVLAWNRALEQLSGVSAGDIIGKGDHEYGLWSYGKRRPLLIDLVLHPDQDAGRQDYTGILWEGRSVQAETVLIRSGGHRVSLMIVASPLLDPSGETIGAIESMRDITRLKDTEAELARINQNLEKIVMERTKELEDEISVRKQAEVTIRASLDEKVILLREIHHRVKNNLQIIISLTNLQMRQTEDPVVKEIMAETQSRVRAMALVHEKLYGSKSLSRIDFADYTRFLATQHLSYYGSGTKNVHLDFVMSEIMVDIDTAVPLGLIMNELISNALKHAFPNGKEGTISLRGRDDGNLITIVVKDNGIGIPADFDWKNTTSLGMRLIISLVDQLNGTIDMDTGEGTTFRIQIPKNSAL